MPASEGPVDVYMETGQSRAFASALDWPGWCRSGRDETAALQALLDYSPRYAFVFDGTPLVFRPPAALPAFRVVERQAGNFTTDYGTPNLAIARDAQPVGEPELERWHALLSACWQAFDKAAQAARGKELRKGPRGGGRDLDKIVAHVFGAEKSYLTSLGGKVEPGIGSDPRQAVLAALVLAAHGQVPARGPRGGLHWSPRYFVRRAAWHVLDHAWEIEDRAG